MGRCAAASLFFALACFGQDSSGLEGRIRSAPLAEERRAAAVRALEARDYTGVEQALSVPPGAPPAQAAQLLALLGAAEFLGGRLPQAIAAFGRSDVLRALEDRDRFTYAMALAAVGDAAGARLQLERLDTAHPDYPLYLYWLARIDYYERRYEDAASKLERVTTLEAGSSRSWDNLGLAYDMMGESAKAQPAFEKAVALNRKLVAPSPWPPLNFGVLLFRLQKFAEAEALFREALRYDPRSAQGHFQLGRTLEKLNRDSDAIDELTTSARLDPTMAEPEYSLALLYRRLGRAAEAAAALAEYRKRRAAAPNSPPAPLHPDRP